MHFSSHYRWLVVTKHLKIEASLHSVLDVGCDDGYFLSQIEAALKDGVNLNPPSVEKQYSPVIKADACQLPFARGTSDNAFAFDIIEHIEDDIAPEQGLLVFWMYGTLSTQGAAANGQKAILSLKWAFGHFVSCHTQLLPCAN